METSITFSPIKLMVDRIKKAKEESDTTYFYDLMLMGELVTKIIVSALVGGVIDDKNRNRYRQLHRLVRADGLGEWSTVLDEITSGVSSQYLQNSISQFEQKELQSKCKKDSWQFDSVKNLVDVFPSLGLLEIPLPERVQARQWFSFFAQLRNGTKGHGAMQPDECSTACIGLERSLSLLLDNFYLFKREWVFLHQNLNGKYRVTNLNQDITNFEELKNSTKYSSLFLNGIYAYFDKKTFIELISSDSDATDFYLPNGNFREKTFEMLSYISNQRQQGDSTKYLVPANELPESETQGLGILDIQGNCFANIPPVPNDYIKRKDLENDLTKILEQEDRYPIVTLVGRGGIGKTTLALSVLKEIAYSKRFDLILWFSSRDIDLKLEGPKPVKNLMLSEQDIADEFIKLTGVNGVNKGPDKVAYLATNMGHSELGKILFVLDNFETVQNPAELFNWIDTYVRNPNKVLITSRISKSFKADYPIEIQGMNDAECRELIDKTSESFYIRHLINDDLSNEIIDEAQGHPYIIKILLGQIARNPKSLHIERIMASQEDILIALFRRTYATLTPAAKRIFLTLCSWRSVVPLVSLEAVMLRPDIKDKINVEEAVDELRKSSFIDIIFSGNDNSTFISVPLAAFLFGKGELEVSPMKIAILSDRELLTEFGVTQQTDIQNGILPRIERKFRAVANRISQTGENLENHRQALEFLCRKFPYAWNFLYQLYIENDKVEDAQECLREYLKNNISNEERKSALIRLANLYRITENWFAEVNSLTELAILPNASLEEISDTANIINNYFFKDETHTPRLELDDEIKESLIKKIAELMNRKMNEYATATDYSRLAWLYMHLQDPDKAKNAVEKGLAKDYNNPHCSKLAKKLRMI